MPYKLKSKRTVSTELARALLKQALSVKDQNDRRLSDSRTAGTATVAAYTDAELKAYFVKQGGAEVEYVPRRGQDPQFQVQLTQALWKNQVETAMNSKWLDVDLAASPPTPTGDDLVQAKKDQAAVHRVLEHFAFKQPELVAAHEEILKDVPKDLKKDQAAIELAKAQESEDGFYTGFAAGVASDEHKDAVEIITGKAENSEFKEKLEAYKLAHEALTGVKEKLEEAKAAQSIAVTDLSNAEEEIRRLQRALSEAQSGSDAGRATTAIEDASAQAGIAAATTARGLVSEKKNAADEAVLKAEAALKTAQDATKDPAEKLYQAAQKLNATDRQHLKDVPGFETLDSRQSAVETRREALKKKEGDLEKRLQKMRDGGGLPERFIEYIDGLQAIVQQLKNADSAFLEDSKKINELNNSVTKINEQLSEIESVMTFNGQMLQRRKAEYSVGLGPDGSIHTTYKLDRTGAGNDNLVMLAIRRWKCSTHDKDYAAGYGTLSARLEGDSQKLLETRGYQAKTGGNPPESHTQLIRIKMNEKTPEGKDKYIVRAFTKEQFKELNEGRRFWKNPRLWTENDFNEKQGSAGIGQTAAQLVLLGTPDANGEFTSPYVPYKNADQKKAFEQDLNTSICRSIFNRLVGFYKDIKAYGFTPGSNDPSSVSSVAFDPKAQAASAVSTAPIIPAAPTPALTTTPASAAASGTATPAPSAPPLDNAVVGAGAGAGAGLGVGVDVSNGTAPVAGAGNGAGINSSASLLVPSLPATPAVCAGAVAANLTSPDPNPMTPH